MTCEHGKVSDPDKRQYRLINESTWNLVEELFPGAITLKPTDTCNICKTNKESKNVTKTAAQDWYDEVNKESNLKALLKADRGKAGIPVLVDFVQPTKFHLVEREGVERWRSLVSSAKEGVIDVNNPFLPQEFLRENNTRREGTRCDHNKALVPRLIRDAIEGKEVKEMFGRYGQSQDGGGVLVLKGDQCSIEDGKEILICEVISDQELKDLNKSLVNYNKAKKELMDTDKDNDCGTPNLRSLNSFTRSSPFEVKFQPDMCEECMEKICKNSLESRKNFTNKAIRVIILAANHSVPGKVEDGGSSSSEKNEDDLIEIFQEGDAVKVDSQDTKSGGLLGAVPINVSPATSSRRSSRQQSKNKAHDILVDSSDMLGKLRLKVLQICNLSPYGQHIYLKGVELPVDKNTDTIASLKVLAGR